jgi:hypothetical protein
MKKHFQKMLQITAFCTGAVPTLYHKTVLQLDAFLQCWVTKMSQVMDFDPYPDLCFLEPDYENRPLKNMKK